MTSLVVPIGPDGPIIEVEVSLEASFARTRLAAGLYVPPPVTVSALIDTGADVTVVDPTVLTALAAAGLVPARLLFLNSPGLGGLTTVAEYLVGLAIGRIPGRPRSGLVLRNHPVVERGLGNPGAYQALIGRDVLDQCALFYDGPGRTVTVVL